MSNAYVLSIIDNYWLSVLGEKGYNLFITMYGVTKVGTVYVERCLRCEECILDCDVAYYTVVGVGDMLYLLECNSEGELVVDLSYITDYKSLNKMCRDEIIGLMHDLNVLK